MKQRSIPKVFILQIVTFGIYRLYWFIKTRRELMERTGIKIASPWLLIAPALLMVGVFIALFGSLIAGAGGTNAIDQCLRDKGFSNQRINSPSLEVDVQLQSAKDDCEDLNPTPLAVTLLPILIVLISFAYLPLVAWWLWSYTEAAEKVTNQKVSRILGMILFLVVPDGIDILIMQDYYNKVPQAQGAHTS